MAAAQELLIESRPVPLGRGWAFRTTGEGTFYWFEQPLSKAQAQEATRPFWFDLEEGVIYIYSKGELGDSIFDRGVQLDIDLQALLAGEPE